MMMHDVAYRVQGVRGSGFRAHHTLMNWLQCTPIFRF